MCWKWRYSCGHTADIECHIPKRDLNDPEDDELTFACDGFPKNYTNVDKPCMKCLIDKAEPNDDSKANGNSNDNSTDKANGKSGGETNKTYCNNTNGNYQNHNGRGNDTWGAGYMGEGWINVTHIGTWPWDQKWMVIAAGMKYDEDGVIVDDPDSKIDLISMEVRNETFQFDPDARYEHFTDELEALSSHPAYGSITAYSTFVKPADPYVYAAIKHQYGAYGAAPVTPPVLSPSSSRTSSAGSYPSIGSKEGSTANVNTLDDELDTPNTQYSFDNDVGRADEPDVECPDSPGSEYEKMHARFSATSIVGNDDYTSF